MNNEIARRIALGYRRCLGCNRWFIPSTRHSTRCFECVSVFYQLALREQWILPDAIFDRNKPVYLVSKC